MADEQRDPVGWWSTRPVDDDPLVVAMLAIERLRGMESERSRLARQDGPLTRAARRIERAITLRA